MVKPRTKTLSRRKALATIGAGAGVLAAGSFVAPKVAITGTSKVKVGILLPYSGTYARLGDAITNGLKLRIAEGGDKIAGHAVEYVELDSEAAPPKAAELTTKLVSGDKVDFLIGPVHSGVAMGMAKIAREEDVLTIVPNAGADQLTGALCSPNLFRSSFTNWQPSYPMGRVMKDRGINSALLCYWNYGAGKQAAQGFKDGFGEVGGTIVKEIGVPFPEVEFQAVLTEIAAIKPEAVFVFFAGGGAVKWVKDYAAAGLKDTVPLFGSGFLTEGVTGAQGEAAEGLQTTLHYADTLDNAENIDFREAYQKATGKPADVYAVQGYDAGTLMEIGLAAAGGDVASKDSMIAAMSGAQWNSPRGPIKMSAAHNPIQNFYLREVRNGINEVIGVAYEGLADPAKGCKMA